MTSTPIPPSLGRAVPPTVLAKAVATGGLGAALSVRQHPRASRAICLALSLAAAGWAAWVTVQEELADEEGLGGMIGGVEIRSVDIGGDEIGEGDLGGAGEASDAADAADEGYPVPEAAEGERAIPVAAVAVAAAGAMVAVAGLSEAGIRAQGRLEDWAQRTTGRPRLVVGITTGLMALALDVLERRVREGSPGVAIPAD